VQAKSLKMAFLSVFLKGEKVCYKMVRVASDLKKKSITNSRTFREHFNIIQKHNLKSKTPNNNFSS